MRKKSRPEQQCGKRAFPRSLKKRQFSSLRALVCAASAAALSACTVSIPVEVTATQGALPASSVIELASYPTDESLRSQFGSALEAAFASHNVRLSSDGAVIAEFAVAERSATSGTADPAASTEENIVWSSEPRESHWWDQCEARRLRGTLVLLNRADGSLLYRGTAEAIDCDFGVDHLNAMAQALVQDSQAR